MRRTRSGKGTIKKTVEEKQEEIEDIVNTDEEDSMDMDGNDDSDGQSSKKSIKPFTANINMRRKRGNKMGKLIRKQQFQEDADDFWKENKYFGKIEDLDEGDNVEGSDFDANVLQHLEEDSFDEDFKDSTTSEEEDGSSVSKLQDSGGKKVKYRRTKKSKIKRNYDIESEISKIQEKNRKRNSNSNTGMKKKKKKEITKKWKPCFIHEVFKQEELLRNAVYQEHMNKFSLKRLLSIEQNRKKTQTISKKRKIKNPISYKSMITAKGKISNFLFNKNQKDQEAKEILDDFYSIDNTEEEEEESEEELLGKREEPEGEEEQEVEDEPRRKKYLDPKTGAYFDTIDEFKKIRAVVVAREYERCSFEKNLLKKMFVLKKRKFSFGVYDGRG